MKNGIGFITEDRKVEGLMLEESIMKNISLANLKRISRHGVIQREKEKELVRKRGSRSYISGVLDRSMNVIT